MNRRFTPDKHIRIRRQHEEKNKPQPSSKPKKIHIYHPLIKFKLKPKDQMKYFIVNPGEKVDLYEVRDKLNEYFSCLVNVHSNIFNTFDVVLDEPASWEVICRNMLKVLKSLGVSD